MKIQNLNSALTRLSQANGISPKPEILKPVFGSFGSIDQAEQEGRHRYFVKVYHAFEQRLKQAGYQAMNLPIQISNTWGKPTARQQRIEKLFGLQVLGNYLPTLYVMGLFFSNDQNLTRPAREGEKPIYESQAAMDNMIAQLPELIPADTPQAQALLQKTRYHLPPLSTPSLRYFVLDATKIPGLQTNPEQDNTYWVNVIEETAHYSSPEHPTLSETDQLLVAKFRDFLQRKGIQEHPFLDFMRPYWMSTIPDKTVPWVLHLNTQGDVDALKDKLLATGKVYPAETLKRTLRTEKYPLLQKAPLHLRLRQQLGLKLLGKEAKQYVVAGPTHTQVDPKDYLAIQTKDFPELASIQPAKTMLLSVQYTPPSDDYVFGWT